MERDYSFFRSKVTRRVFGLFIASALIPLTGFALLFYQQLSEQLSQDSEQQLRRHAKAIGLELIERLSNFDHQIEAIVTRLSLHRGNDNPNTLRLMVEGLAPDFSRLTLLPKNGRPIPLLGTPIGMQSPLTRLRPGGRLLLIVPDARQAKQYRVQLAHALSTPIEGYLIGELKNEKLWRFNQDASPLLWVLGPHGETLFQTESTAELPPASLQAAMRSPSGIQSWMRQSDSYLLGHWTIFLDYRYGIPDWKVVLAEPEATVLSETTQFERLFLPTLLLTLLVITLLSVYQIRRSLRPLDRLKAATRRIAGREFDTRVEVNSGDEFEELASAFNSMTSRLGRQFQMLSAMTAIDRAILAAQNQEHIARILLVSIKELVPYDRLAIGLLDSPSQHRAHLIIEGQAEDVSHEADAELSPAELAALTQGRELTFSAAMGALPGYLDPLVQAGMTTCLVFPILTRDGLAAFICLGYQQAPQMEALAEEELRNLTDRAAVAFSNAVWGERLHHQAHHDPLTGLPNRLLLKDRLDQAIKRTERNGSRAALLFLDLDRFKEINDTLGHTMGDQVLVHVAQALSACVRRSDTLVRLGGDEFTILMPDIGDDQDIVDVTVQTAERLLAALGHPFQINGHETHIMASIGIALYPEDGEDSDSLIKAADLAMYHAKATGRGHYQFFSRHLQDAMEERSRMLAQMHRALAENHFRMYYQAKIDIASGRLAGAEALIRWFHPEQGQISPASFLPHAEESGMILPLGEWILETVCRQIRAWQDLGGDFRVAVNLSARQFARSDIPELTQRTLEKTGAQARHLELEITEGVLIDNIKDATNTLNRLKALGIRVAIDDFGTGYSSLNYLKQLPVDTLKIDQSFIRGTPLDKDSAGITKAIIAMAHSLEKDVVAEGVELQAQLDWLRELGCEYAQGYLFSPPLPAEEFAAQYLAGQA
jgi:diguanylate cyclase (GGDEF)-like protein